MSNPLSAAIIGVGAAVNSGAKGGGHQIGRTHARAYAADPRVRLTTACDINAENLNAFRELFDVPHGFADYREMLNKARPDILSICTYVGLHKQMIVDAANAGVRAIFCEKPFVATPGELHAVDEVVRDTGVKLVLAHFRRYRPAFAHARQLYLEGAVGEPMLCAAGIAGWDLSEWGSHWLDMFRYFHDDKPVQWVLAQGRVRDSRGYGHHMEEHAVANFAFEGGGRGMLDGGQGLNGDWAMSLVGTDGVIRVLGESQLVVQSATGQIEEEFHDPQSASWEQAVGELVDWLEGGPEPRVGYSYTRGSAELNLAAYVSMLRGDRVDLPLGPCPEIDRFPVDLMAAGQAGKSGKP